MHWDERIIPDETENGIVAVHLKRYDFARQKCKGQRVLDLGCGVGYGTAYLADEALSVTGIDCNSRAIHYAQARYHRDNTAYLVANAEELPFPNNVFEVVCSFENIEHVSDPERYLAEVTRTLKPDGIFFISTPLARESKGVPVNPHHYQEWSSFEFKNLLESHFSDVEIVWQIRKQTKSHRLLQKLDVFNRRAFWMPLKLAKAVACMTRTVPFVSLSLEDVDIVPVFSECALAQIGVCAKPK